MDFVMAVLVVEVRVCLISPPYKSAVKSVVGVSSPPI